MPIGHLLGLDVGGKVGSAKSSDKKKHFSKILKFINSLQNLIESFASRHWISDWLAFQLLSKLEDNQVHGYK